MVKTARRRSAQSFKQHHGGEENEFKLQRYQEKLGEILIGSV
ncbi:hypothetical protein [Pseudomonas asplenii]|nr:hypothetical protein [Pseudomonas asplenii]